MQTTSSKEAFEIETQQQTQAVSPLTRARGARCRRAPVGHGLARRRIAFIRKFIVLGWAETVAASLWLLHTHAFDAADQTPYLNVKSADKQCGKTRLLEVLGALARNPHMSGGMTASVVVYRAHAGATCSWMKLMRHSGRDRVRGDPSGDPEHGLPPRWRLLEERAEGGGRLASFRLLHVRPQGDRRDWRCRSRNGGGQVDPDPARAQAQDRRGREAAVAARSTRGTGHRSNDCKRSQPSTPTYWRTPSRMYRRG